MFDGSTLATGGEDFTACRIIPAAQHGTRGVFTWEQETGDGVGYLSVFDANGVRHCGPTGAFTNRTVTCRMPDGPATVIFNAGRADATYRLSHQTA